MIQSSKLFKLIQVFPWISKFITVSSGYKPDIESEKDYIFGASELTKSVIKPDGQWTQSLPADEVQRGNYVETMGCTGYGLLNVLETIVKLKNGTIWNKSDRYTNKMTGTGRNGNGMKNVLDITRKSAGLVDETTYPWNRETFDWNQYYSAVPVNIQKLGENWLKEYQIGYEKVWCNKQLMMEAIKYSPLYVAGYAWYQKDGLYRSYGQANHCFTIVGYVEGSHWIAYDSYSPHLKHLDWDFSFGGCYIVFVDKINKDYNQSEIDKLIKRGFKYVMRTEKINGGKGQIYELTSKGLKELTDKEKMNEAVRELANRKDLTGISEIGYGKLIK